MAIPIHTSGLIFPLKLIDGKHVINTGMDLIKSSIKIILAWPLYTRIYEGLFGSRIHEVLEDPNDVVLIDLIHRFIIDAISFWERRIELMDIRIDRPKDHQLFVQVFYRIREINITDSLKYNFYIN